MRISVVIPCFEAERWLGTTLASVQRQTLPAHEILVVDNGSRDSSVAVAESFGAPVRVLHEARRGAAAARATGAEAATGDALMFLDADDVLGPTVLECLADALTERPDDIAVGPWRRLEPSGDCWLVAPASCAPRGPFQDDLSAWLTGWYHPPCAVLWSRAAYRASGGWDPEVAVNQDGDVTMRALLAGVRLHETRSGCSYYRRLPQPEASVSGSRTTRRGLDSRLFVLDRIAGRLAEAKRLRRYRPALSVAFDRLAAECDPDHPELAERVRERARAYGATGGRPLRTTRLLRHRGAFAAGPRQSRTRNRQRYRPDATPHGCSAELVSVVIPAFDRERLIRRAIDSVLAQTHRNLEVLVVDDCSRDRTAEVVESYTDPRVRLIRQDRNRGVAAARNRGLQEARGAYVALLDSDDEWKPEKIAKQLKLLTAAPRRVGIVYTGIETRHAGGVARTFRPQARGYAYKDMLVKNELHGGPSSMLMRREVFDTVGGFDTTMPAIEDHEWFTRTLRFFEVDYLEEPLAIYHDETVEADGAMRRSRNFAANMAARAQFRQRYRYDLFAAGLDHLYLVDSADRHLASPFGDRRAAAGLVLRALKRRPGVPGYWVRLMRCAAPRGTGTRVRSAIGLGGRKRPASRSPA